jgi:hypothetical protein
MGDNAAMRPSRRVRIADPVERVMSRIERVLASRDAWIAWPGHADGWLVPSTDGTQRHYVDASGCSCAAFVRPCKHTLAVRLHLGLVTADDIRRAISQRRF